MYQDIWRKLTVALSSSFLIGCSELPPFVLTDDQSVPAAPLGPKVASLIANLKCELWDIANDDRSLLPYYRDVVALSLHDTDAEKRPIDPYFTLKSFFQQIDYVATATYTIDVFQTAAANPSINSIVPFSNPMFNFTLAVGGQLSDTAHRNTNLNSSVDFMRLVESDQNPLFKAKKSFEFPLARDPTGDHKGYLDPGDTYPCDRGSQLGGRLGLKETVATGAITANMNDVAVFEPPSVGSVHGTSIANASQYILGQFSAQIDFTITVGLNGGPNWTLSHFKGPSATSMGNGSGSGSGGSSSSAGGASGGGGSSGSTGAGGGGGNGSGGIPGTLGFNRQTKDTVIVTFIPVCIRQEDYPIDLPKVVDRKQIWNYPINYVRYDIDLRSDRLSMGVGTPGWANYLPPCNSEQAQENRALAPGRAFSTNLSLQGISNLINSALPTQ
jgi:uncharacterized membrane protein YgcG